MKNKISLTCAADHLFPVGGEIIVSCPGNLFSFVSCLSKKILKNIFYILYTRSYIDNILKLKGGDNVIAVC